jgi:hypothetical protein
MLAQSDGGGIYVVGAQTNGMIAGNYVYSQVNAYGDIYLDQGSTYWIVTNNVSKIGSNPYWLHLNLADSNTIQFNFADSSSIHGSGTGNIINSNTVVSGGNWPAAATAIMNVAGPGVATNSINLGMTVSQGNLTLFWPTDHIGWRLQVQTNATAAGLGSDWTTVSGSTGVNNMSFLLDQANGAVFFRLAYP